ncbi:MAG: GNAT family N-acetyltransferase [Planctomycetota bacterium]
MLGGQSNKTSGVCPIELKEANLQDVNGIVRCHLKAFPGQFMTEMGPHWLRGLYSYFIRHEGGISLVTIDGNGNVLGFAVGGDPNIRDGFLKRAILRYPHLLLYKSLTSRIVRSKLIAEVLRKLYLARSQSPVSSVSAEPEHALRVGSLLSIAVLPRCQGTDIAGMLMEYFRKVSIENGYDKLRLSAHLDNTRAIVFYKKHSWREVARSQTGIWFVLDLPTR